MKVKIFYRSPVVWNKILFIFLSFGFIYLQEIFLRVSTITEKQLLADFALGNIPLLSLYGLTILLIYLISPKTKIFFGISVLATTLLTVYNLTNDFSKLVLIILFFYMVISYFFYQFFEVDRNESFYNPKYDKNFLYEPMLLKLEAKILRDGKELTKGYLTNWSPEGCFIYCEENAFKGGKVEVEVLYEGNSFKQEGHLVSKTNDNKGYGVKFVLSSNEEKNDSLGWRQFYGIIDDIGLKPELII